MHGAGAENRLDRLVAGLRRREPRAVGRAITIALGGGPAASALRERLRPAAGRSAAGPAAGAHRVGLTGAPGVGKSTLAAALSRVLVDRGEEVAIIASDPRSPFSGGAFLGDRVRLAAFRLAGEPRVFFRSLASGGESERSALACRRAADVLEAAGYRWIIEETVGAGQSDVAIAARAGTTVVVVAPEAGDEMQVLKAGILEIADVIAVNRADRPGALRLRGQLEERARFSRPGGGDGGGSRGEAAARAWRPRVVLTEAIRGTGAGELLAAIEAHRAAAGQAKEGEGVESGGKLTS